MIDITTTTKEAAATVRAINAALKAHLPELLSEAGNSEGNIVRKRIQSQDEGRWPLASKWVRAKKGTDKALFNAERYVKVKVVTGKVSVYGQTGQDWTLTQHDQGFTNELIGKDDKTDGGKVVLTIRDPSALGQGLLNLKRGKVQSSKFEFTPRRAGITPRRKIWSTDAEVKSRVDPMSSRWARKVISEVQGVRP